MGVAALKYGASTAPGEQTELKFACSVGYSPDAALALAHADLSPVCAHDTGRATVFQCVDRNTKFDATALNGVEQNCLAREDGLSYRASQNRGSVLGK
jgi:hypothetical protein